MHRAPPFAGQYKFRRVAGWMFVASMICAVETLPFVIVICAVSQPPYRHRDWAHPGHVCTGTGLSPAHICTGTGLTPAHICAGTGPTPATSAPGLRSPLPHLHRDWAHSAPRPRLARGCLKLLRLAE